MKTAMTPRKKCDPVSEYDDKCPLLTVMELIGGKWKLPILWYLAEAAGKGTGSRTDGAENGTADCGTVRYNELKRRVRGVTNMMLTKCLRELEAAGLVLRCDFGESPPRVEYALTETGQSLMPILRKLYRWEARRVRGGKEGRAAPPDGRGGTFRR